MKCVSAARAEAAKATGMHLRPSVFLRYPYLCSVAATQEHYAAKSFLGPPSHTRGYRRRGERNTVVYAFYSCEGVERMTLFLCEDGVCVMCVVVYDST